MVTVATGAVPVWQELQILPGTMPEYLAFPLASARAWLEIENEIIDSKTMERE